MRVLYFINAGIMGGTERHVMTLVQSLPRDVEALVCSVSPGEATEAMTKLGIRVVVLGGRNGHDLHIIKPFIRLIKEYQPDVIHAHSDALLPFIILRFFRKIPLVLSIHGPTRQSDPGCAGRTLKGRMKERVLRFLRRKPDYVLPVSQATWEDYRSVFPKAQGEVLFNALNIGLMPKRSSASSGHRVIGMVGRMAGVKDWPSFVNVCAEVLAGHPDIEAWAIGDGPVKESVKRHWTAVSKEAALDADRIKWLGSRQDARELIAQMDVLLITSVSEQMPTTMLEAFAIGTPVAGFLPMGGMTEILALSRSECALIERTRDVHSLAKLVIRLLDTPPLRDRVAAEGRRIVVDHFDFCQICRDQLLPIYRRISTPRCD